jgi:nitroimidazol reductase NimA-like FMN-containing flavoprotein (pyridoxamine 5'-phosphate oxidase superfamily)
METSIDARTGLEILDRDECLALVRRSVIGRLAVSVDNQPLVFPVNFVLDGSTVVFRTNEGTKLWAARHAPVVFECDGIDATYHTGWSVMIAGHCEEPHNPLERDRLARLPLRPWCDGEKPVWLIVRPHSISGRRIPAHGAQRCTP